MISPNFVIFSANMSQQDFGNQEWEIEKILGNKCVSGPLGIIMPMHSILSRLSFAAKALL